MARDPRLITYPGTVPGITAWLISLIVFLAVTCQVGGRDQALEIAKSMPQYPDSRFLSTFKTSYPDDVPSSGITYETDDDPQKAFEFYQQEVVKLGWTIVRTCNVPDKAVPKQLRLEKDRWWCAIVIDGSITPGQIRIRVGRK